MGAAGDMDIIWGLLLGIGVLAALLLAGLFLIKPRREQRKLQALRGVRYAHRGLHNQERGVPENSLKAFRLAAANGFGAEMDVRLTKDRLPVVFHDKDLSRMCGVEGAVETMELRQLQKLQLAGTGQRIPALEEVLALFEGKAPLIIELKTGRGSCRELCTQVCRRLEGYRGDYCIESFDPRVLRWLRRNEPFVLRGQLVECFACKTALEQISGAARLAPVLLTHVLTRPDFVACRYEGRDSFLLKILRRWLKAQEVSWTIRDQQALDAVESEGGIAIFEGFLPARRAAQDAPQPEEDKAAAEAQA